MSATGFLIGVKPDGEYDLIFTGTPYESRQEFKRLTLDPSHGLVEILGYDTYSGPQPRKRRRFKKNALPAPVAVTETVADGFETEPEPYIGPEPEPKAKKATKKRGKKKE